MKRFRTLKTAALAGVSVIALASAAAAADFNIPAGGLEDALNAYTQQSGRQLLYPDNLVKGMRTRGAAGEMTADLALSRILTGTGLSMRHEADATVIVRDTPQQHSDDAPVLRLADAAPTRAATSVETVVVTSSKIKGDIQTVPIAITALSQEQLTSRQIAGGPDLVKEVPNLTFTKTNFTGYSIQIRGIGTQAISVATDPAVAVALNDIPFIRNHFFEQEFFDVGQVEVLRGPQGTLYGRNATAGVVNVITAKPTDQFEAMASADWGNFVNRRYEGMVNIPIVDDRLDLRVAGEWTKRDGYSTNQLTGNPIDGRDLWSTRVTLGWKPSANMTAYLVWEHFQESDDRMRTSKQLCKTDPTTTEVLGLPVISTTTQAYDPHDNIGQACLPVGLYDKGNPATGNYGAFGVPNGLMLPYYEPLESVGAPVTAADFEFDPYASTRQSTNLRVIESTIDPKYIAKNDTLELNADYNVTPALTFSSQTGYNNDFLWSTEDYNRFNTRPGAFAYADPSDAFEPNARAQLSIDPGVGICKQTFGSCAAQGDPCTPVTGFDVCQQAGIFCDPQLGCSDRLVAEDLSDEHSWQLSQEFRLASNFSGPFNFSVGGNYMHYETDENYYVFINALTLAAYSWSHGYAGTHDNQTLPWNPGVSDNSNCLVGGLTVANLNVPNQLGTEGDSYCQYIDPNPIGSLNNQGHNYFLSQNPYVLNSYAGFGEAYYNITPELKLTGGLRWTDDKKRFIDIPSEVLAKGYGYPIINVIDQEWQKYTGRLAANWSPKLDFTDQTLIYGSFAHGYKAGGANPPGATLLGFGKGDTFNPIHPLTFKPEFIDAYELGTKNTLADGGLTLNGDVFFYNYTGYQISRIVDRTAINDNFDATVKGAELEAMYEPIPGLKFNFAGGYEDTRIKNGQSSIDLMDRADSANHPGWMVVKPFVTQASNCVLPDYVVALDSDGIPPFGNQQLTHAGNSNGLPKACAVAYDEHLDPITFLPYGYTGPVSTGPFTPPIPGPGNPPTYYCTSETFGTHGACNPEPLPPGGFPGLATYQGFDPLAGSDAAHPYTGQNTYNGVDYGPAPNNGEGFAKNLGGNQLPNAPHFTMSFSGEYTMPLSEDWAATLHGDFYWQSQSMARVFNDKPYDKLRGYSTTNLALILTSASGWQVMGYVKNVFDVTAITGDFLNSDDSGLTTNVFLTDPRLYGLRVTKNW
jgi:iron complex outermembrane receptor protein